MKSKWYFPGNSCFSLHFSNITSFLFGKILISTFQLNFNTLCIKLNWEDLDYVIEHFISLLWDRIGLLTFFFYSYLKFNYNPQRQRYKCLHNTLFLIYMILTLFKCYIYIMPEIIFTRMKPFLKSWRFCFNSSGGSMFSKISTWRS